MRRGAFFQTLGAWGFVRRAGRDGGAGAPTPLHPTHPATPMADDAGKAGFPPPPPLPPATQHPVFSPIPPPTTLTTPPIDLPSFASVSDLIFRAQVLASAAIPRRVLIAPPRPACTSSHPLFAAALVPTSAVAFVDILLLCDAAALPEGCAYRGGPHLPVRVTFEKQPTTASLSAAAADGGGGSSGVALAPPPLRLVIARVAPLLRHPHFILDALHGHDTSIRAGDIVAGRPPAFTPEGFMRLCDALHASIAAPPLYNLAVLESKRSPYVNNAAFAAAWLREAEAARGAFDASPNPADPGVRALVRRLLHFSPQPTAGLAGAGGVGGSVPESAPDCIWRGDKGVWEGLLVPELLDALCAQDSAPVTSLLREEVPGWVWSFPLLTAEGCAALIAATEFLEDFCRGIGVPVSRPNTMNRYGLILQHVWLGPFVSALTNAALTPVAEAAFPLEALPGGGLAGAHAFTVAYDAEPGKDSLLDMHSDHSDVTFNVCLGKDFTGATLTFCGALGTPGHRASQLAYAHVKGRCVVHRGRQRHGADAIESGHRRNLIVWCANEAFRALPAVKAGALWEAESAVDPVCVSFTHDRDATMHRPLPEGVELGRRRAYPFPAGSAFII